MKYLGAVVIGLFLVIVGYMMNKPQIVDSQLSTPADHVSQPVQPPANHDHDHMAPSASQAQSPNDAANTPQASGKTGNPHFDQLTPEMQQAVKDSLLLEGPMKTYKRPDGTIVLPSNGRFTQMPVAVQMPDGTIQIKEYSVVPKPTTPEPK